MSIRYLIAAALMASACAAQADVMIGSVTRSADSDAQVQALYDKVSAAVGSNMKVSLKQGVDGVYVTGLSTAQATALAGDGMSVIATSDGFKIVQGVTDTASGGNGGGANMTPAATPAKAAPAAPAPTTTHADVNTGNGNGTDIAVNVGAGTGNDTSADLGDANGSGNLGNAAADAASVPEPSTVALMLAGMLGVAGLGRRRSR